MVEIDHVTKRFGDFVAVDDAHFAIAEGEFFSMLGPSGCGKTTTLRMIAGFETPTSGAIRLEGDRRVAHAPQPAQREHGLPAVRALPAHDRRGQRRLRTPVAEGAEGGCHGPGSDEILEVVRLADFAHRRPGQLSGGQQQRVALARALVNLPKALLLDEPLGALDLKLRQAMQFELKRIQREVGITFVYVTHDQEEALTMSDRIAVMNDGHVEQIGTPTEIYDEPASVFVAGFIGQANLWPGAVRERSASRATFEAFGGVALPATCASHDLTTGQPATLMVRPERVTVTTTDPTVDRTAGERARSTTSPSRAPWSVWSLRAPDGTPIVAHVSHDADLPLLRPGDTVFATWSVDAGCVLPPAPRRRRPHRRRARRDLTTAPHPEGAPCPAPSTTPGSSPR